jgi:hypothetical protein
MISTQFLTLTGTGFIIALLHAAAARDSYSRRSWECLQRLLWAASSLALPRIQL